MQKRGAIEVQFNWIFVLIAGGLILAFFVMVANMQLQTADFEREAKLRTNVDTVLNNAQHSAGTIFEVNMGKSELEFRDCFEGIWVGKRVEPVQARLAFGPDLIKSTLGKTYLWAVEWDMPYRVDNFIFMASSDVRYVIVKPQNPPSLQKYAMEIYNGSQVVSLPSNINKVLVDESQLGTLQASNYYKTKFVFVKEPASYKIDNTFNGAGINASAVLIEPTEDGLDGYGKITFKKKVTVAGSTTLVGADFSYYLGRPSVLAAIFAENKGMYECGMMQAIKRLNMVSGIYQKMTATLNGDFGSTSDCGKSNVYAQSDQYFGTIFSKSNKFDPTTLRDTFRDIYAAAKSLGLQNRKATMLSCPLIY